MSIKSLIVTSTRSRTPFKRVRPASEFDDLPEPTQAEIDALGAALNEASDAADLLIASLDRCTRSVDNCLLSMQTVTTILRNSNQFAVARVAADAAEKR